MNYLALESEPAYRPKVYKIQIKQYGLRKAVRVESRRNNRSFKRRTVGQE